MGANGFSAVSARLGANALTASFQRQALGNASPGGPVKLEVKGRFRYGIPFAGGSSLSYNRQRDIGPVD